MNVVQLETSIEKKLKEVSGAHFLANPLGRILENTLLTMGSRILKNSRLSSGLNTRDWLYSSVTEQEGTEGRCIHV
jgi:hypothetical protein